MIKSAETAFNNNDIFILKVVGDKIVLNNDYKGLFLLDKSLNIIKEMSLNLDFQVYDVYMNHDQGDILIYSPDNYPPYPESFFYHIDIIKGEKQIIKSDILSEFVFSSNYRWENNLMLVYTYSNDLFLIDSEKNTIQKIEPEDAEEKHPQLYSSLNTNDKKINEITWGEYEILIAASSFEESIYPKENFAFGRVDMDPRGDFVLISSYDKGDKQNSRIDRYQIDRR